MEIDLTPEQSQLRDMCREFALKELVPNAKRWDREHAFPKDAVQKLAELGLLGIAVPTEWGGAGMDNVSYALAMESVTIIPLSGVASWLSMASSHQPESDAGED